MLSAGAVMERESSGSRSAAGVATPACRCRRVLRATNADKGYITFKINAPTRHATLDPGKKQNMRKHKNKQP